MSPCRLDMVAQVSNIYALFRDQAQPQAVLDEYKTTKGANVFENFGVAGLLAQHMFLHQEVQEGRMQASETEALIKDLEEMMVEELEQAPNEQESASSNSE